LVNRFLSVDGRGLTGAWPSVEVRAYDDHDGREGLGRGKKQARTLRIKRAAKAEAKFLRGS
jgi:hypothetical protein